MKKRISDFWNSYKVNILILFYSLITFLSFLNFYGILFTTDNYNIITILGFVALIWFYKNIKLDCDKRTKKFAIILSVIIGTLLVVGNKVNLIIWNKDIAPIFDLNTFIAVIVSIFGFSLFAYRIVGNLLIKQKNLNVFNKSKQHMKIKWFILAVLLMLLCWIPYFLRFFPGILTNDSYRVLNNTNLNILNDNHTFGYTFFFGILWKFGMFICNDMTLATALYTIIQMFLMSLIYNFSIKYFYDKGLNKIYCIFLYILFAFNPLHAYYSITIWRDILFSGALLLLVISLFEIVNSNFKLKIRYIILFVISVLAVMFFRNNGIYVYLFILPFLFILTKNNKLFMRSMYIMLLIMYFVIKGPIYNVVGVEKGKTTEAFSIPLQQISRVISLNRRIDKDTLKELNEFLDTKSVKTAYVPYISDSIKAITNNENLSENGMEFINAWLKLLIKYPGDYLDAYLSQTLGYWFPNTMYWTVGTFRTEGRFETEPVYNTNYIGNVGANIIDSFDTQRVPFFILVWSVGLQFYILLFATVIAIYNKKGKYLLCYIPIWGLWLSIMVATPVFCELRYVYSLFLTVPFLLIISLYNKKMI